MEKNSIATACTKCGVTIQDATAQRNSGLCQPCADGRSVLNRTAHAVPLSQGRSIDWQCIGIEKHAETDGDVTYRFVADIWEPNPEIQGRFRITGQAQGLMRIIKASGEVLLDQPMPGDTNERRFNSAARKVRQHWTNGESPEKTMFACG